MKIWLLYLSNSRNKLHAYTDNYLILYNFFKFRKKSKFTIKTKDVSKKKYPEFKKIYSNYELKLIEYHTQIKNEKKSINIISNIEEHNETIESIYTYLWKISDYTFNSYGLNKEYRLSLDSLLFNQIYKFTKEKEENLKEYISFPYYSSYGKPENFIIDEFLNIFYYDDFKFFLEIYKKTIKNKL